MPVLFNYIFRNKKHIFSQPHGLNFSPRHRFLSSSGLGFFRLTPFFCSTTFLKCSTTFFSFSTRVRSHFDRAGGRLRSIFDWPGGAAPIKFWTGGAGSDQFLIALDHFKHCKILSFGIATAAPIKIWSDGAGSDQNQFVWTREDPTKICSEPWVKRHQQHFF